MLLTATGERLTETLEDDTTKPMRTYDVLYLAALQPCYAHDTRTSSDVHRAKILPGYVRNSSGFFCDT